MTTLGFIEFVLLFANRLLTPIKKDLSGSQGGTLLIGVEDNGNIFGLGADLGCLKNNSSLDQFERHLRQCINTQIGSKFLPYLVIRFEQIQGKDVCAVYVRPAPFPAFLRVKTSDQDVTFYIRLGNETKALKIPELYDYWIQQRSPQA